MTYMLLTPRCSPGTGVLVDMASGLMNFDVGGGQQVPSHVRELHSRHRFVPNKRLSSYKDRILPAWQVPMLDLTYPSQSLYVTRGSNPRWRLPVWQLSAWRAALSDGSARRPRAPERLP